MAADTLPLAAVQVGPPPELRDRIMAVVRSEAELLSAAEARADAPHADPQPAAEGAAPAAALGALAAPAAGRRSPRARSSLRA